MKLSTAISQLDQDFKTVGETALSVAANGLADQIRQALSVPPGGPHDYPWLRTGTLRDSVEARSQGPDAVVASTSDVAVYQEHGTATITPRPTFAPIAAKSGEGIAHAIGLAVATALGAR